MFNTKKDAQGVYNGRTAIIQRTMDKDATVIHPPIGEQSFLVPGKGKVFILNQMVFMRCNTVVAIDLGTTTQIDLITAYATRLDQRIQANVC